MGRPGMLPPPMMLQVLPMHAGGSGPPMHGGGGPLMHGGGPPMHSGGLHMGEMPWGMHLPPMPSGCG